VDEATPEPEGALTLPGATARRIMLCGGPVHGRTFIVGGTDRGLEVADRTLVAKRVGRATVTYTPCFPAKTTSDGVELWRIDDRHADYFATARQFPPSTPPPDSTTRPVANPTHPGDRLRNPGEGATTPPRPPGRPTGETTTHRPGTPR
jgi:hypothetical protein